MEKNLPIDTTQSIPLILEQRLSDKGARRPGVPRCQSFPAALPAPSAPVLLGAKTLLPWNICHGILTKIYPLSLSLSGVQRMHQGVGVGWGALRHLLLHRFAIAWGVAFWPCERAVC